MVSEERLAHLARFSDEQLACPASWYAVVHHLQGGTVTRLSIERGDPNQGTHTKQATGGGEPRGALREVVAVLVAGEVAATIQGAPEDVVRTGGKADREQAIRRAAEAGVDEAAARAMIEEEWPRVRARLEEPANWMLVDTLARQLVQRKVLDADEIRVVLGA